MHSKMDVLLRRWKLLAIKYKRDSHAIHEKITEILISMPKNDIRKLDLGKRFQPFKNKFWFKIRF